MKFLPLLLLLTPLASLAQPVNVGDLIAPREILDQHDIPYFVDQDVRLIMFGRDMKANKIIKQALMASEPSYLSDNHAIYIIDVSGMPKFITKNFAVPKMRKYPYPILLDRDASVSRDFPSQQAKITLFYLNELEVRAIEYAEEPAAIRTAIESLKR